MPLRPNTDADTIVRLRVRADNLRLLLAPEGVSVDRIGLVENEDGTHSFMATGEPPAQFEPVDEAEASRFTQPFSTVLSLAHQSGSLEQATAHREEALAALARLGFESIAAATNEGSDHARATGLALVDGELAQAVINEMAAPDVGFEQALRTILRERGAELPEPDDQEGGEA